MTFGTIFIFGIGMFVGAAVITIVLGFCMTNNRSALEGEIMELTQIVNRQQEMLEIVNKRLEKINE